MPLNTFWMRIKSSYFGLTSHLSLLVVTRTLSKKSTVIMFEKMVLRWSAVISGGGAVYHDLNNLNYTIISKEDENKALTLRALNSSYQYFGSTWG